MSEEKDDEKIPDNAIAAFVVCFFLAFWLCAGSPDIIDAIVYKLCGKFPQ